MLAVEIRFYGAVEPLYIPIRSADRAAVEAYFESLKMAIIEAQRHSRRSLRLRPFDRRHKGHTVEPLKIAGIDLIELLADPRAGDHAPAA